AQDSAGDELEDVAVFADDDGVACVVASGDARDVIERTREIIDSLALAFITPLRANHDDRFHSEILLARLSGMRDLHLPARRDTRVLSAKSARHTNFKSYDGLVWNASEESERRIRWTVLGEWNWQITAISE